LFAVIRDARKQNTTTTTENEAEQGGIEDESGGKYRIN